MKKFLLIIVALLISIWSLAITASNRTLIIIAKSTSSTTIRPNSLDSIPFYCTYESSDGIVWIDFMENVGRVSITVSNLSSGETVYDIADSFEGSVMLHTYGKSGYYTLQIMTESGDVYEGEFTVD